MNTTSPPSPEAMSDIVSSVELLDELEAMIVEGRRVPFSSSVVINEEDALDLVDRARLGLPQEVVEARHTVVDRGRIIEAASADADEIVAAATAEAERLVAEARVRAAEMVADHEILAAARGRADALLGDAEIHAAEIHAEADAYARQVMEELEDQLARALGTVRNGLESLPAPVKARGRRTRT